jgi:hypothetical protein
MEALVALGCLALYILLAATYLRYKAHVFHCAMRRKGRLISWTTLEPKLRAGEGVLIVNRATSIPGRLWWCPDQMADPEEPLAGVIYERALLVDCPWTYRGPRALARAFPSAMILENREEVFHDPVSRDESSYFT